MEYKKVIILFCTLLNLLNFRRHDMEAKELKDQANINEWVQRIRDCKSSGLSIDAWCKVNGISRGSFFYWQRKVMNRACTVLEEYEQHPVVPASDQAVFAKVEIKSKQEKLPSGISLKIGELDVHIGSDISCDQIRALLKGLSYVK